MSIPIEETRQQVDALVAYLQNSTETKDTDLAHELHDELGVLMGAAVMDLDAVRRVKPALSQYTLDRIDRLEQEVGRLKEKLRQSPDPAAVDAHKCRGNKDRKSVV